MPQEIENKEVIQKEEVDQTDPKNVDAGQIGEVKLDSFSSLLAARHEGTKSEQVESKKSEKKDTTPKESDSELEEETEEKDELQSKESDDEGDTSVDEDKQGDEDKKKEAPVEKEIDQEEEEEVEKPREKKVKEQVAKRDYSQFDSADVPILKQMGNAAFNRVKDVFKELKELKSKPAKKEGDLPDNYYSHPDAYVLDPKYKETSGLLSISEQIQRHWKAQEFNISKNGKISDLGYNQKTGQLEYGAERDATKEDVIMVEDLLTKARDQVSDVRSKLKEITTGFKSKMEQDVQIIKKSEAQFFPEFDKADHPTQPLQKEIIKNLPPSLQASPLASLLAKVGAHNALLLNRIKELEKGLKTKKSIDEDKKQEQPKKEKFGSKTIGAAKDFSIFARAREEG